MDTSCQGSERSWQQTPPPSDYPALCTSSSIPPSAAESHKLSSAVLWEGHFHTVSESSEKPYRDSAKLNDLPKVTHSSFPCTRPHGTRGLAAVNEPSQGIPHPLGSPEPCHDWLDPNWLANPAPSLPVPAPENPKPLEEPTAEREER